MFRRVFGNGWTLVLGSLLLVGTSLRADPPAGNPGQGHGRPGVELDSEATPLQKALEQAIDRKKERESAVDPACANALASGDERRIARQCRVPEIDTEILEGSECPDCGDRVNPNGRVVGKKTKTRTTLVYEGPDQRGVPAWNRPAFRRPDVGAIGDAVSNRGLGAAGGPRLRNAVMFPDSAINEDRDCIDEITGEHLGGFSNGQVVADGEPGSCFEVSGPLKQTLGPAAGGCEHLPSGTLLPAAPDDGEEDLCFEADGAPKATSLVPSIDEDGPDFIDDDRDGSFNEDPANGINDDNDCIDASGTVHRDAECLDGTGALREDRVELIDEDDVDAIDQDGDGRSDEDPPATDLMGGCRDFGASRGLPPGLGDVAGDECDLGRAIKAEVNRQSMAQYGKKLFRANDNGEDDDTVADDFDGDGMPDSIDFGAEMRKVVMTEALVASCEDDQATLVEGQCVSPPAEARSSSSSSAVDSTDMPSTLRQSMMMGFTFAPPVLEWGYRYQEYACLNLLFGEVCFELFYARIGYEFDVAVGLRLPVEVEVTDIPSDSVLAGQEIMLNTKVTPLDFTAEQYRQFCEDNDLADGLLIADCDRFSFPNFFDTLDPFVAPGEVDGDEFVAHYVIFAGVIVRVVGIPIIQWGIDSSVDLPTMCSLIQTQAQGLDLLKFGKDLVQTQNLHHALKNQLVDCGSFTTPFGIEPNDITGIPELRVFPIGASYDIGADCLEAAVQGKTVTIGGKTYPICTNLILGVNGASLGIGLGLEFTAGSQLVTAQSDAAGDGRLDAPDPEVRWERSSNEDDSTVAIGPFTVDNFDPTPFRDTATLSLDDLTYHLNAFQLGLTADIEFGGILFFIPDIEGIPIYNFVFNTGDLGIPIGQHAGTSPLEITVPVENYALALDATPMPPDAADAPLAIKPGEFGEYLVQVTNLGSVPGDFDNFARALSNRPDQSEPFVFAINPNTDFDCQDAAGTVFRGYPYDGVADDCYDGAGNVRPDRTELIDEDPIGPPGALEAEKDEDGDGVADEDPLDDWRTVPEAEVFAQRRILGVQPYTTSGPPETDTAGSLVLAVSPFRHPLTAPGIYPVRVAADSLQARQLGLDAIDPSGNFRLDASDVVFIEVASFFEPTVGGAPEATLGGPGTVHELLVEGINDGNAEDSIVLGTRFADFNLTGCTLTTLGTDPGCPHRAVPTAIPADWTTVAGLPGQMGPLNPLQSERAAFQVAVPADWAGLEDTTYQIVVAGTSTADTAIPPASSSVVFEHTVIATMESKTRYVGLEIEELIAEIERANAEGISTGGLLPISLEPAHRAYERALERTQVGNLAGAQRAHRTNQQIVEAFLLALGDGHSIPVDRVADWSARAQAILQDLALAATSEL